MVRICVVAPPEAAPSEDHLVTSFWAHATGDRPGFRFSRPTHLLPDDHDAERPSVSATIESMADMTHLPLEEAISFQPRPATYLEVRTDETLLCYEALLNVVTESGDPPSCGPRSGLNLKHDVRGPGTGA